MGLSARSDLEQVFIDSREGEFVDSPSKRPYVAAVTSQETSSTDGSAQQVEEQEGISQSVDAGHLNRAASSSNLNYFHQHARILDQQPAGIFTKVRGLAVCYRSRGHVELHRWARENQDELVVVKKVPVSIVSQNYGREADERFVHKTKIKRSSEDVLSEIGIYSFLSTQESMPTSILRMRTAFYSFEDVWLVLDYCNGGDLFNVLNASRSLELYHRVVRGKSWSFQLFQAVQYLHEHHIAHRDISIENILLAGEDIRLTDFGQAVCSQIDGEPLRFFTCTGKPYYRAPECYVPQDEVEVSIPETIITASAALATVASNPPSLCEVWLSPSAVPGSRLFAEPAGYDAERADMFACGVCLFIMLTGSPPWRQATLSDPHFAWVYRQGIVKLLKSWQIALGPSAECFISEVMQPEAWRRLKASNCTAHPWFAETMEAVTAPVTRASWEESVSCQEHIGDPYSVPDAVRSADALPRSDDSAPQPLPLMRSCRSGSISDVASFQAATYLPVALGDPYGWESGLGPVFG